jgi:hypothetical protein
MKEKLSKPEEIAIDRAVERSKIAGEETRHHGESGAPSNTFNPVEGVHPHGAGVPVAHGEQLFNPVEGVAPGRSAAVQTKDTPPPEEHDRDFVEKKQKK